MKIRRLALTAFAVAALFGASEASAQTIGFKLGASFANLDIEDDDTAESMTSLTGGGFIRFGFGGFALQPELMFVTRGAQAEEGDITSKIKLDYIEVPVLAVVNLPLAAISPYLYAGPNFAFNIGCSGEVEGEGGEAEADCPDDESVKSTDIGLSVGGGLTFAMGPGAILIDGRYTFGMTDIDDGLFGVETKTRTAAITAGYQIPLGGF